MKIKLLSLFIAMGTFLVSFSACDTTDTIPEDAITDLNYWTKVADLKQFANSFYPSLSAPNQFNDNQSDNAVTNTPNEWLFNTVAVPGQKGSWANGDWTAIRNLNYFLGKFYSLFDMND